MQVALIIMACVFMIGCAATPAVHQKTVAEEPAREVPAKDPGPEAATVVADKACTVSKLQGTAYMHDADDMDYIALRVGDRIPIGKIFYLEPKTTMKLDQGAGEKIFLYSKDHEVYYKLETTRQ